MTGAARIPAWLHPHRNEWVSGCGLNRLLSFERGGKVVTAAYVAAVNKWPAVRRPIGRGTGYALYRQVKDVIAKARAHGFTVREPGAVKRRKPK